MARGNTASEPDQPCDGWAQQSWQQHMCRALPLSNGHLCLQNNNSDALTTWQACYLPPPKGNGNATYYASPQIIHWITSKVRAVSEEAAEIENHCNDIALPVRSLSSGCACPAALISSLADVSHDWGSWLQRSCSARLISGSSRVQGILRCIATFVVTTVASPALSPSQHPLHHENSCDGAR